ncbi:hypothetical protein QYM36_002649 [Artemia franciscana]|uniref:Uncharacterized protein n=1 Tax=Artemia franciscana TaxID=6661 RepID=A0AA88IHY4_ARTSF|nr:hypothetical protein QYM36_002649 [Artemia franciscana]
MRATQVYDAVLYAKGVGIHLLIFSPHTSSKPQPRDVSVYGPLKTCWYQAIEKWLISDPGRAVTEYEISKLLGESFPKSFTPANIASGFSKPGIHQPKERRDQKNKYLTSVTKVNKSRILFVTITRKTLSDLKT